MGGPNRSKSVRRRGGGPGVGHSRRFRPVIGAMYPGAILGLAWIFVCGSPAMVSRMPTIAGLTAATIGAGGTMSYGILHGYAQADTLPNYAYGFFTLFCQGGCWGTFGCALAGLLAERKPMRTGDWLGLIGSVFLGGWLASVVIVEWIGFHVNPPRNDISVAFLGAAIGQFLWLATHNRPIGLRGAAYGFIGFGLGMAFGRLLANAFRHLETIGWSINHWNVMEVTCGFVGGGVFTFGMLGLGRLEPDEKPSEENQFHTPNAIGAFYVLGLIPLWHIAARTFEKYPKWSDQLRKYGFTNSDGLATSIFLLIVALGSLCRDCRSGMGHFLFTWSPLAVVVSRLVPVSHHVALSESDGPLFLVSTYVETT